MTCPRCVDTLARLDNLGPALQTATEQNARMGAHISDLIAEVGWLRDRNTELEQQIKDCAGCRDRNTALDEFAAALDDA